MNAQAAKGGRVDGKVAMLVGSGHLLASKSGEKGKKKKKKRGGECSFTMQDGRNFVLRSGGGGLSKVCTMERGISWFCLG